MILPSIHRFIHCNACYSLPTPESRSGPRTSSIERPTPPNHPPEGHRLGVPGPAQQRSYRDRGPPGLEGPALEGPSPWRRPNQQQSRTRRTCACPPTPSFDRDLEISGSPGWKASLGTPDAVNSGPRPPRRAALAPRCSPSGQHTPLHQEEEHQLQNLLRGAGGLGVAGPRGLLRPPGAPAAPPRGRNPPRGRAMGATGSAAGVAAGAGLYAESWTLAQVRERACGGSGWPRSASGRGPDPDLT